MINVDKINCYVEKLVKAYPGIKAIWLFGSRVNNSYRTDSDWDLLVFANQQIFDALKQNECFHDDKIDLLVVFNDKEFEKPWPDERRAKHGSLKNWEWVLTSPELAAYKSVKCKNKEEWFKGNMVECKILKALRIWPPIQGAIGET